MIDPRHVHATVMYEYVEIVRRDKLKPLSVYGLLCIMLVELMFCKDSKLFHRIFNTMHGVIDEALKSESVQTMAISI